MTSRIEVSPLSLSLVIALAVALAVAATSSADEPEGPPEEPPVETVVVEVIPFSGHLELDGAPSSFEVELGLALYASAEGDNWDFAEPESAPAEVLWSTVRTTSVFAGDFQLNLGDPDHDPSLTAVLDENDSLYLSIVVIEPDGNRPLANRQQLMAPPGLRSLELEVVELGQELAALRETLAALDTATASADEALAGRVKSLEDANPSVSLGTRAGTGRVGFGGGNRFPESNCPAGEVVTGVKLIHGTSFEAIEAMCSSLSVGH